MGFNSGFWMEFRWISMDFKEGFSEGFDRIDKRNYSDINGS